MFAMAIYVAVFLWAWPLARSADALWLKTLYALTPVPPIVYVVWLMARRVLASDELEQRTHLIGVGVAAAAVSIFGIVSGFLAAAHVLDADFAAAALMWIFPLLTVIYAIAQAIAARRYGSSACFEEGLPVALRFLYLIVLLAALAAYLYYRKGDMEGASTALGLAIGVVVCAAFFGFLRWMRRRSEQE